MFRSPIRFVSRTRNAYHRHHWIEASFRSAASTVRMPPLMEYQCQHRFRSYSTQDTARSSVAPESNTVPPSLHRTSSAKQRQTASEVSERHNDHELDHPKVTVETQDKHETHSRTSLADDYRASSSAEDVHTSADPVLSEHEVAQQPYTSSIVKRRSPSQMLREIERKKEALNLKPRPFSTIAKDYMGLISQFFSNIPMYLQNALLYCVDRMKELKNDPSVAKKWGNSAYEVLKKEGRHYWNGIKLLYADGKRASSLVKKSRHGPLSRTEKLQVRKFMADLLRMVPFLVFVMVPFLEFAIPIAIKMCPGMLPSQFVNDINKEDKDRRKLKVKLEIAKFLQDTMEHSLVDMKNKDADTMATAQELLQFLDDVRDGRPVSNEDIVRFAKLFRDEFTLDSLDRPQLIAMCRLMDLSPYSSNAGLRMQIRRKLRQLKAVDREVYWEGVNSLTLEELMIMSQERGMRIGLPKKELRRQLNEWIQLSLDFEIPSSLLILSRTFHYTQPQAEVKTDEALKKALGSLPTNAINDAIDVDERREPARIEAGEKTSQPREVKLVEQYIGQISKQLKVVDKADGYISVKELREATNMLEENKPQTQFLEKIIGKLDQNQDGKISVATLREELLQSKKLSENWMTKTE